MIIDITNKIRPLPGLPMANKPNRKTHAKMLISITCLIPNFCKKKGMVSINNVSDIWEMDNKRIGCCTPNESGYVTLKLSRNELPKALVICKAAPNNMANRKKMNSCRFLNNTRASRPMEDKKELFLFDCTGGQEGIVKAYSPNTNAEAA